METGQIIQHQYKIIQVLGQGSMGTTYKACNLKTQSLVALKVLHFSRLQEWKGLELFEREARVLRQLSHPRIPKYVDYFSLETPSTVQFLLVQEYIEGKSLQGLIEEGWRGTETEILDIFMQLVEILIYLHGLNPPVIHRDINPQNLILSPHRALYLVDFGAVQEKIRTTSHENTTVVGTYGYVPLEQFNGRTVPASDYYAVGATLLYLLTHQHPGDFLDGDLKLRFPSSFQPSPKIVCLLKGLLEPSVEARITSPDTIQRLFRTPINTTNQEQQTSPAKAPLQEVTQPSKTKIIRTVPSQNQIRFCMPINLMTYSVCLGGLIFDLTTAILISPEGSVFSLVFFPMAFFTILIGICLYGMGIIYEHTELDLTPDWIARKYRCFGLTFACRLPISAIHKVTLDSCDAFSPQNISIYAGTKSLQFGRHLKLDEQKWLIHEINQYLSTYAKPLPDTQRGRQETLA